MKISHFLFFCSILALFSSYRPLGTGKIKLEIVGFQNNDGQVLISLYDGSKGFPTDPKFAYKTLQLKIENKSVYTEFQNLPHGEYAISLLHDANMNNKMDYNFFGIPKEGFAFSNNYRPKIKNPSFKNAQFSLNRSSTALRLEVIY
jgi:uncharacterized protein (DUF2141 family)